VNASDEVSVDTLNQGLSPTTAGETHSFVLRDAGASSTRTVMLQASAVTETPVPMVSTIATASGPVGYLLFNDHIATAESELIAGIRQLQSAGVTDLVLDLRYNGGGYLDIASELAYMIAGPVPTAGRVFDQITFNAQYPSTNPVTGAPLMPTAFHNSTQGFSVASGASLPYLALARVFVLTGPGTCSASEAVMNGLDGVGVQVIQIGSTTCGKPYGFYPQDNCGTTYFSIQFQSSNAQGFSGYSDGFSPQNAAVLTSAVLPGCSVADDFSHALGDPAEARLSAALGYRNAGACTVAPSGLTSPVRSAAQRRVVSRSWLRENSIGSR
jgi:carboxyl-terminal processing protease